ncbi:MAG TPA: hypothetical protein VM779_12470 [Thermoanaerobaculia bacterium]|nr:hypothetical protein [Thermoanaerobaculia bacterium]
MATLPGERVLIADGDAALRQHIYSKLLGANVFADCVMDGRSAIAHLRESGYAVILLDIGLPNVGAERVLEFVRQAAPGERPVILVLGEVSAARSLDVDLVQIVIRKPCDLSQLSDLVQSCVRRAQMHRDPIGVRGGSVAV